MYINPMELPPGGPAARLACAILAAQAKRMDRLNNEVVDELVRYERSRTLLDDLIDRLIGERDDLDLLNVIDVDLEDGDEDLGIDDELPGWHATHEDDEPTLGWTDREARTGAYGRNAQDDDEPTLGSGDQRLAGSQAWWGGWETPLKLDDVEDENEHGDSLDEGEHETADNEPSLGWPLQGPESLARDLGPTDAELDPLDVGEGQSDGAPSVSKLNPRSSRLRSIHPDHMPSTYCMVAEGTCLEPLVKDGTKLMFSSVEPVTVGDLVAIYRRPEATPKGHHQVLVKQLAFPIDFDHLQRVLAGDEVEDGRMIGGTMLNPPTTLAFGYGQVLGVHKCLGPLPAGTPTYKVSNADLARPTSR